MDNQILSFLLNVPYIPPFLYISVNYRTSPLPVQITVTVFLLFHSELFFLVILNTLTRLIIIKPCHSYTLLRNPNLLYNTSELFRLIYDLVLTNPTF